MRDDHESLVQLVAQVEEELVQLRLVVAVEAARRLIGEHHQRVVDQGTGYRHALLLASRQLCRLVLLTLRKAHHREQLAGPCFSFGMFHVTDQRRDHHVLQCRELRQELMKLEDKADVTVAKVGETLLAELAQVVAVDQDASGIGLLEGTHDHEQGGLPGTTGADD